MAKKSQTTSTTGTYTIGRPCGVCALSENEIAPGEQFMSTLCERIVEDEPVLLRLDICQPVWEEELRPEGMIFYWQSVMPSSDDKDEPLVDDETLLELFERLADQELTDRQAFRFVLGLILMRKRILRCVRTRHEDDGSTIWEMKCRGSDPKSTPMDMLDPKITNDRIQDLADQLGEILRISVPENEADNPKSE